jgi:hypothetical protein
MGTRMAQSKAPAGTDSTHSTRSAASTYPVIHAVASRVNGLLSGSIAVRPRFVDH